MDRRWLTLQAFCMAVAILSATAAGRVPALVHLRGLTQTSETWSDTYGAWPSSEPRQASGNGTCTAGHATAVSITRLGRGNGWAGGQSWVGAIRMVCSDGTTLFFDAQPDNDSPPAPQTATSSAGFKSVSIASGWAIDNLFNLPGGNPSTSNFSCPDGTLISGFAAAAVSYPLGWIVDLRLRCSASSKPQPRSPRSPVRSPTPTPNPSPTPAPTPAPTRPPPIDSLTAIGPIGGYNAANAFDDLQGPSAPAAITSISVMSGGWIDAIRVSYGSGTQRVHGAAGRTFTASTTLTLAPGEYITDASVASGAFVDAVWFTTSTGREVGMGNTGSGVTRTWASPCPSRSFRLVGMRGSASQYLEALTLVWEPLPGLDVAAARAAGLAAAAAAGWQCSPAMSQLIRRNPNGSAQPQCLARAGDTTCLAPSDCWTLLACATSQGMSALTPCSGGVSLATSPRGIAPTGSYQDPTGWCPRAQGALGLPVGPAPVPLQAIFLVLTVCGTGPAATAQQMQNSLYSDPQSLKNYWNTISFGRTQFNETTSMVRSVTLPCGAVSTSTTNCPFEEWVRYIDANAAALGVPELPAFTHRRVFVVPDAFSGACGIGFWNGRDTYIDGGLLSTTTDQLNVFKHEMGHSLGLPHSSTWDAVQQTTQEYNDGSTPMGYCQRCSYVAPHLLYLGWSRAIANLTSAQLAPGTPLTYQLPALLDSVANTVAVHVDWPLVVPPGSLRPLGSAPSVFLSFRIARGQDAGLPARFDRAVSIHTVASEGANTYLEGTVGAGASWSDPVLRLVVRMLSQSGSMASISVCRFTSSASEC